MLGPASRGALRAREKRLQGARTPKASPFAVALTSRSARFSRCPSTMEACAPRGRVAPEQCVWYRCQRRC